MFIKVLRVENFRNLKQVEIRPHPKLNFLFGLNGAGKTSLLEALVVLARGKSFKTAQAEELAGAETGAFRIFLESDHSGRTHKMGLERQGKTWRARKDGQDLSLLSELTRHLPVVLMEPNSHLLVSGAPDGRRRFLDWGVFHVEPGFLEVWRRYSRALKQRNAALRDRQLRVLDSVDQVLAPLGEELNLLRLEYFQQLKDEYAAGPDPRLTGESGQIDMQYQAGWKGESLLEALKQSRKRDLERGATHQGPHRADLQLSREGRALRSWLSRGEQKNLAAALLLTQARLLAKRGEEPLLLLDDLASEFDQFHFEATLENALDCAGQVWVSGTLAPDCSVEHKVFHVEHGAVREVV